MNESISSCAYVCDLNNNIFEQCRRREILLLAILKAEIEALRLQVAGA